VGALLVGEQHQLTVAKPRLEASVVQQHQRQQSMHLGLIGHQLGQRSAESQGFGGELAPGGRDRVPLVEDQVHDRDYGAQPLRQQMVGWHPERDPGGLDLALGPDQPLGHRRLSDQEGVRDLSGAQAAERPQGEGDLSVGGERRMAAGEDELESLIGDDGLVHRVLHRLGHREQARLLHQSAIAANPTRSSTRRCRPTATASRRTHPGRRAATSRRSSAARTTSRAARTAPAPRSRSSTRMPRRRCLRTRRNTPRSTTRATR
jgi:hypothetical protein